MFGRGIDSSHNDSITLPIYQGDDSLFTEFWMFAIDDLDRVTAEDVPFRFFGGFSDLRFDLFSFGEGCLHQLLHYLCSCCHVSIFCCLWYVVALWVLH